MADNDDFFLTGDQAAVWDILTKIKMAATLDEARALAEEGLQHIKESAI